MEKKKKTRLINYLFAIIILILLCGIFYRPPNALRKQAREKTKAEIKLISTAVEIYISLYGFPHTEDYSGDLDFAEYLSTVLPNSIADSTLTRPMLIDFEKQEINFSNQNYNRANASSTTIWDPFEQPYIFLFDSSNKTFMILSPGLDGEADIPQGRIDLPESYDSTTDFNRDNITSVD